MIYIKCTENKDLIITVNGTIYRGENLNQKITFLLPRVIDEVSVAASTVYLTYVHSDESADVVALELDSMPYNNDYLQYTIPVVCEMTKHSGDVCLWLQLYSGDHNSPIVAKTGECTLRIHESRSTDDCLSDSTISAIYKMQEEFDERLDALELASGAGDTEAAQNIIAELKASIAVKADRLAYDDATRKLRLLSGDTPLDEVTVPSDDFTSMYDDTWSSMIESAVNESNNSDWEEM